MKYRILLGAAGLLLAAVLVVTGMTALDMPARAPAPGVAAGGNVLYIVIDTLRPDHLGCYGYARPTSPVIDAVAREGAVFEQAYSPGTYTGEIVTTLFSGVLPSMNPTGTGWYPAPDPDRSTLPEHFQQAGYRTGFFTDHVVFTDPNFRRGFDVFEAYPFNDMDLGYGPKIAAAAMDFLDTAAAGPFFMYVHILDPHGDYKPPEEYRARIDVPRYPDPPHLYGDVRARCHEFIAEGFGPGEARFEDMIARYDAEIAYTDDCVGRILDRIDDLGLRDTTTVVILSDHGEEFLEHRFVEHAWTLYNEVLHVPLIIRSPGRIAPQRIATRVSTVDVFPTLLELAGIPHERTDLSGFSLFHRGGGPWAFRGTAYPIVSELRIETRPLIRSVISGDYKLIRWQRYLTPEECAPIGGTENDLRAALRAGTLEYLDLWAPVVYEELYNIADDPREQHNLLDSHPERRQELTRLLVAYEHLARSGEAWEAAGQGGAGTAPRRERPPIKYDPELEERLRALGYAGH